MLAFTNAKNPVSSLFKTKYIWVWVIGDILPAQFDVIGLKELYAFGYFAFKSDKNTTDCFKNIQTLKMSN